MPLIIETCPTISTCTQSFANTSFIDYARFGCTFFEFAAVAANLDQVTHDQIAVSFPQTIMGVIAVVTFIILM